MLLGGRKGWDPDGGLSSVNVLGLDNCSVPDLPEWRYDHGSFVTESGALAVCGGWWGGKPASSDCLVLNRTSNQWERGVLNNLTDVTVVGVAVLDGGTYMVHPEKLSVLPSGSRTWVPGHSPPENLSFECAARISPTSFLAFSRTKQINQYEEGSDWVADAGWPNLRVERQRPACASLGYMTIVAGGVSKHLEVLKSVEMILHTKRLSTAEDLLTPRSHFSLLVLETSLVALGGSGEESIEIWGGAEESWREAVVDLQQEGRNSFSAMAVTNAVCPSGPAPPHSCPTLDGGTCNFPFTNGELSKH